MEEVDVAVIGAGVIGLAVARALSGKETIVLEKNPSFGQETSSRNSEVIHAGLYYPGESLKAETCIRGNRLLYEYCGKHGLPHKRLGKLIVASDGEGMSRLDGIFKNAAGCGVNNLKILDRKEIKKLEPSVEAEKGIFSPDTGIFDTHEFMKSLFNESREKSVDFAFSVEAVKIEKKNSLYEITVKEPGGELFSFRARSVINSAGLFSDKIASLPGIDIEKNSYKIHFCKGEYWRMRSPKKFSVSRLIYPPPTKIDLGIHVTPDLAGGLRLGPDAHYVEEIDYGVDEKNAKSFYDSAVKYVPSLAPDDLIPDTAGIRAKLQGGDEDFRDFVIKEESGRGFPGFINIIGIESPGLTGSLAIAELVKKLVDSFLGLG